MPLFVRKFVVDAIETGLAAVLAISVALPGSVEDAKALGLAIGVALLGGAIAAARRAVPGFLVWLNEKLGTSG